jgi:hypothetical protein
MRGNILLPIVNNMDSIKEFIRFSILEQIAFGSSAQSPIDVLITIVSGQDNNAGISKLSGFVA